MNKNLNIPENIKSKIDLINNVPMNFGTLLLDDHPDYPNHTRYMKVIGFEINLNNTFVWIKYIQVGINKETNEEIILPLQTPDFVLYKSTWSYLKDTQGNVIEAPLKEQKDLENPVSEKIKVPSVQYMISLSNSGASISQLMQGYLPAFKESVGDKLNQRKLFV